MLDDNVAKVSVRLEKELSEYRTCKNFLQVQIEGNREVKREIDHYNLDMIISLGYRINSKVATKFRQWATERLKNVNHTRHCGLDPQSSEQRRNAA